MKSDFSLGDLKKQKKIEKLYKMSSQKISNFFDIEAPCETRTSLFYRL